MTLQILRNGSEGKEVEHWQNFLIGEDFLQGQADGDFGPLTEQATKAFQRSQNITADGMVGPRTLGSAMVVGFDPGDSDLYRFLEVGAQQRADEDDRMDLVAHKVQRRMLQWAGAWVSLIVVLVVLVSVLGGRAYVNDLLVPQVDEKINDVNEQFDEKINDINEQFDKKIVEVNKQIKSSETLIAKAKTRLSQIESSLATPFYYYREAVANARVTGEQVLQEYQFMLNQDQRDRVSRKPLETVQASRNVAPREFNPDKIADEDQASATQVVLIRMRAWDVVARYNDVLTGLAEGKSAAELTAAADGLFQSLSSFPVEEVAEAAGSIAPFMGVLKTLIGMAAEERSRQDFIKLVDTGAPLIQDTFLKLLRDDTKDFYEVRKALSDRASMREKFKLRNFAANFLTLVQRYKPTDGLRSVTAKAKAVLDKFGMGKRMEVNNKASKIATPLVESQLEVILFSMEAKASAINKSLNELNAFYLVLKSYVKLIDQFAATLTQPEATKTRSWRLNNSVDGLVLTTIQLRWTLWKYYDTRWK